MEGLGRAVGSGTTIRLVRTPAVTRRVPAVPDPDPNDPDHWVDEEVKPAAYDTYELSGLTLDDLGLIEQHLLSMRVAPEDVLERLAARVKNPLILELMVNATMREIKKGYNKVTNHELAEYVDTPEGTMHTFWLCLRKKNPQFDTLEKAKAAYEKLTAQEQADFVRRRNLASGTDAMGNSTGPTERRPSGDASSGRPASPTRTSPPTVGQRRQTPSR